MLTVMLIQNHVLTCEFTYLKQHMNIQPLTNPPVSPSVKKYQFFNVNTIKN